LKPPEQTGRLRAHVSRRRAWILGGIPVAVTVFCAFGYFVARPLHAEGFGQPVLRWIAALSQMLALPGMFLGFPFIEVIGHQITTRSLVIVVALNFAAYAAAAFAVYTVLKRPRSRIDADDGAHDRAVSDPARRVFLRRSAALGVTLAAGGLLGYAIAVEPQRVQFTRVRFPVRGLPEELDGITIAQLSDVHLGPFLSEGFVRDVVDSTNRLQPDMVVLTGDYIHQTIAYMRPCVAELARLKSRVGTVAVLGNHDWWGGVDDARAAFRERDIPLLDNTRIFVTRDRRLTQSADDAALCIAGVGDLWEDQIDLEAALAVPASVPRILLSHNPDVAEEYADALARLPVSLMLSGHTHGGQVRLPVAGAPIVPSRYGQKYAAGLVQGPACPVYVSRGVGTVMIPVRFGVPPEVPFIQLTRA
jgi:uncharacterized protein